MFIVLLDVDLYREEPREVTVLLLHLPLLKNEAMLLFKGRDHIHAVFQVAQRNPFVCFSAVALKFPPLHTLLRR